MGLNIIVRGKADGTISDYKYLYVREKFLIPWAEYQMLSERIEGYRYVEITPTMVYPDRISYYIARRTHIKDNRGDKPLMSNGHSLELPDIIMKHLELTQDSKMILIANVGCFDLWEIHEHDRFLSSITRKYIDSVQAQFEPSVIL